MEMNQEFLNEKTDSESVMLINTKSETETQNSKIRYTALCSNILSLYNL